MTEQGRDQLASFRREAGDMNPIKETYGAETFQKAKQTLTSNALETEGNFKDADKNLRDAGITDATHRAQMIMNSPAFQKRATSEAFRRKTTKLLDNRRGENLLGGPGPPGLAQQMFTEQERAQPSETLQSVSVGDFAFIAMARNARRIVEGGKAGTAMSKRLETEFGRAFPTVFSREAMEGHSRDKGLFEQFKHFADVGQRRETAEYYDASQDLDARLNEERDSSRAMGGDVGSMFGVSGLDDIIGSISSKEGTQVDAVSRFQTALQEANLSPRERSSLGRSLLESGQYAPSVLGQQAVGDARLRTAGGKRGRNTSGLLQAMTGRTFPLGRLSRKELRHLQTGDGQTTDRLEGFLNSSSRRIMRMHGIEGTLDNNAVQDLSNAMKQGLQAAFKGEYDSQKWQDASKQLNTTYAAADPGAGKGDGNQAVTELVGSLQNLKRYIDAMVGNASH